MVALSKIILGISDAPTGRAEPNRAVFPGLRALALGYYRFSLTGDLTRERSGNGRAKFHPPEWASVPMDTQMTATMSAQPRAFSEYT